MATYLVLFGDVYSHIFCSVLCMFIQISGVAFGMYGHIFSIVSVVYSHFF